MKSKSALLQEQMCAKRPDSLSNLPGGDSVLIVTPFSSAQEDLRQYGEPLMSVLREKYKHISRVLQKRIDLMFVIDGGIFVDNKGLPLN